VLIGDVTSDEFTNVLHAMQNVVNGSGLFEAVLSLDVKDVPGVRGSTVLLGVRPDGYIGMRSDRDHLAAVERYHTLVTARAGAIAK
jgi:hypothetical protein